MIEKFEAKNYKMEHTGQTVKVTYREIDVCPKCHKSFAPVPITGVVHNFGQLYYFSVIEYCSACRSMIMSAYAVSETSKTTKGYACFESNNHLYSVPTYYDEKDFSNEIAKISPRFIKIFNQAAKAELEGLDEIAGIGYRKATEFLIKDYAIWLNPDNENIIIKASLAQCIADNIENPSIKTLATRSAWIGNDETHYVRKHEDRDIEDLKRFIDATIHFISMEMIVADAASIEKK
jgi:hypothetical protein